MIHPNFKHRRFTSWCILLLACSPAMLMAQELRGVAAGVIVYACPDGKPHFLLAYDPDSRRRGWGAFGGHPQGREPAIDTARRELYEETNCVFPEQVLASLTLLGPSRDGPFYSYVAQVPFVAVSEITAQRSCTNVERSFWIWIPYEALMRALDSQFAEPGILVPENPATRLHLWSGAASSLRQARADGYISRQELCTTEHDE